MRDVAKRLARHGSFTWHGLARFEVMTIDGTGSYPDLSNWECIGVLLGWLVAEQERSRKGGYAWPFGDWLMATGLVTATFSDDATTIGEAVAVALMDEWDERDG